MHITPQAREELLNRFTYHAPFGDQAERYGKIRDAARSLAELILANTPQSREQTLSINALDQAVFLANASIARNEKPGDQVRE